MKKIRDEKGVATLFVLISGLFFIAFIMSILFLASAKRQTQLGLKEEAQEIYSNEETINNIKNIVPIYDEIQLLKMGSGEEIVIEQEGNKKYLFSETAQYVLHNNIELSYVGILDLTQYNFDKSGYVVTITKIIDTEDETSNQEEVNYYYMKDYNYPVTIDGFKFDGLVVQYDGADNTGYRTIEGTQEENDYHSNTTEIWKDLSGNNNDGTLNGFTESSTISGWDDNALKFDGTDDYITIQKNPIYETDEYTMHFVIETNKSANQALFCNRKVSGAGRALFILGNAIRNDNGASQWSTAYDVAVDNFIDICIVRDTYSLKLYINGVLTKHTTTIGDKTNLHENICTIGASQIQSSTTSNISSLGNYFSGKMHVINIYNKALTEKEIQNNYKAIEDKKAKEQGVVPIYTSEQLLKIGTGKSEVIEGKEYIFYQESKYYIKNNIEMNYNGFLQLGVNSDTNLEDFNINFNGKSISIKDTSSNIDTYYRYNSSNNYEYPIVDEGYVTDRLILRYDGINNSKSGHDGSATTWNDLTWNGNDGELKNFAYSATSGWGENSIILDGSNDRNIFRKQSKRFV